jgi:hypothetical protein
MEHFNRPKKSMRTSISPVAGREANRPLPKLQPDSSLAEQKVRCAPSLLFSVIKHLYAGIAPLRHRVPLPI